MLTGKYHLELRNVQLTIITISVMECKARGKGDSSTGRNELAFFAMMGVSSITCGEIHMHYINVTDFCLRL